MIALAAYPYRLVQDAFGQAAFKEGAETCSAELPDQEDVSCWREYGHDGPHEDIVDPPCWTCGGLEMHSEGCEDVDVESRARDAFYGAVFVQWEPFAGETFRYAHQVDGSCETTCPTCKGTGKVRG